MKYIVDEVRGPGRVLAHSDGREMLPVRSKPMTSMARVEKRREDW
jgi:hypothetical protein